MQMLPTAMGTLPVIDLEMAIAPEVATGKGERTPSGRGGGQRG